MTVLGVFIVCTGIYSIGQIVNGYAKSFRDVYPAYVSNSSIDDETKLVWADHLRLEKRMLIST